MELLSNSLQEHLDTIQKLIDSKLSDIERSGQMICEALTSGKKILLCGNGGSAADAQHIAAEFVGCYEKQRRSWPAVALTTDTSALTAVSNDLGYEQVFARQVLGLAQAGDVLVAISTSGKSKNVLRAAEQARELGCKTIASHGRDGRTARLALRLHRGRALNSNLTNPGGAYHHRPSLVRDGRSDFVNKYFCH